MIELALDRKIKSWLSRRLTAVSGVHEGSLRRQHVTEVVFGKQQGPQVERLRYMHTDTCRTMMLMDNVDNMGDDNDDCEMVVERLAAGTHSHPTHSLT